MKKLGIAFILMALMVSGCTSTSGKKKRSSAVQPSSQTSVEPGTSVVGHTSQSAPSSANTSASPTSANSSNPTSVAPTSSSVSSSTSVTPVVQLQKIGTILEEHKVGELVSFQATYLRKLTLNNDAVLMFADETGYIGFRTVTNSVYINNTFRFRECRVTGKVVQTDNALELAYDPTFGTLDESVVRLGDPPTVPLSYDEFNTTLPIELDSISDIEDLSSQLVQDDHYYAYGKIVKFTAQYANFEDDNSKEKTLFVDDKGQGIVIIQDNDTQGGHKLTPVMSIENIGKWYELTGIISIRKSIPAVLAWTCEYVSSPDEGTFDVLEATDVTSEVSTEIFKGNLTTDKFRALANESYFLLYHAEGWVYDDGKYAGFTLVEGGTIPIDGKNTRKGFYFVNGNKYDYSEFEGSKMDIWFKIESYDTSNHIWKIFLIDALLPQVYE